MRIPESSVPILIAFAGYLVGVMAFGILSHRFLKKTNFVSDYFVGGRGLGSWVLALTVAATAISGGTFMGFPSLIYSNGWVMAFWIASYMVVPLTGMVLIGKRLNQAARVGKSVTIPDVFRDRFNCPTLGVVTTLLILFFLLFNLVAQFKGGALVMKEALLLKFDGDPTWTLPGFNLTNDKGYLVGLVVFAFTVVAYTTYGGFWAVTWTDVFEGLVMFIGVILLAIFALQAVPDFHFHSHPSHTVHYSGLDAATRFLEIEVDRKLVFSPGPGNFLPMGMAFSMFVMFALTMPGQSGNMVRLMSFKDSQSLRRAVVVIGFYYMVTYFCLIVVFICARAIFPTEYLRDIGTEGKPDSIMPAMIRKVSPSPYLAGLLMAAPYAAIMSTVAAFLLLISSSLVRDLYQRCWRPNASDRTIKRLCYLVTMLVGVGIAIAAIEPPEFLQYIILFTGAGQGCAFVFPMLFLLYWRKATKQGVLAGMLGGFAVLVSLYFLGWIGWRPAGTPVMTPFYMLTLDPVVWGMAASALLTWGISKITRVDEAQVEKYFPT